MFCLGMDTQAIEWIPWDIAQPTIHNIEINESNVYLTIV